MDLQDWEILSDDGFLEIHDDGQGSKVYSRSRKSSNNDQVFQMNYFICPPIVLEPIIPKPQEDHHHHDDDDVQEIAVKTTPIEIKINTMPPPATENIKSFGAADQDNVSQVFFKKMKDTEFADMKVESPKSNTNSSSKGIMPHQIEAFHQYHEEKEVDPAADDEGGLNLNIWKWSLTGIGAICSFGIAAATVCIIILGNNKHPPKQNQKFQLQIETNDKRIRQVVEQASKLNEAISAVRGFPANRAHITFGGYYDAAAI